MDPYHNEQCDARRHKMKFIFYALVACGLLIITRLAYLQISEQKTLAQLSCKNFLVTESLPAQRGSLLDCHGFVLASSRPVYDVYWQGSGKRFLIKEQQIELERVLNALNYALSDEQMGQLLRVERAERRMVLMRDVPFAALCRLYEQCSVTANIVVENRFMRIYPHQSLACHIVGYLNRLKDTGTAGLEYHFESLLQGARGCQTNIKNSMGRRISQQDYHQSEPGADITLTLDIRLQHLVEQLFAPEHVGSFIIMDPEDGAIKALVSAPSFDPNKFLYPLSQEDWNSSMCFNNALLNRACNAAYPPASIFKLVTLAAGCEEGIVSCDTSIDCKGFVSFCGRKYHCMRRWGHGPCSIKQALARSCNVHCYEIALRLSMDKLADYAHRFGLGYKTGFLLTEQEGIIPTDAWKRQAKGEPWWRGETISASIGQSYLQVTPLQVARMISSICTGYLVTPRLLENEPVSMQPLAIAESTLDFLRESMAEAVKYGTVQALNELKNFTIHAKTGTAQTCSLSVKKHVREQYEHAWFTGWFSYKNSKPLTMIILLEHVGSSRYAREMAQKFFDQYEKMHEQAHRTGER